MISLESQNWKRFIGNLDFNLKKSPKKKKKPHLKKPQMKRKKQP